ncbi:MAG: hypothetical protein AAB834_06415, partial [Patescibacteria group bacterium]
MRYKLTAVRFFKFFLAALPLCGIALFSVLLAPANTATYTSSEDGAWATNATWGGGGYPVDGDTAKIAGHTVTVSTTAAATTLIFSANGATLTVNAPLTISGQITLNNIAGVNVTGTIDGTREISAGNIKVGSGAVPSATRTHTLALTGTNVITSSGELWVASRVFSGALANGTLSLQTANLIVNGSMRTTNTSANNVSLVTMATGAQSGTLQLGGATPWNLSGTGTSTITLNGTTAVVDYNSSSAQTVLGTTYTTLKINNTNTSGTSLGASSIVSGLIIGDVAASKLNLSTKAFTNTGTTSVTGTLEDSSSTGGNLFTGLITINNNGNWTSTGNSTYEIRGGITNNGTFSAPGTGTYTFNTNNQTIQGANAVNIGRTTVTTITLTNACASLTVATLDGTGGLTQNTDTNLYVSGNWSIAALTASASGNTVYFDGSGLQTLNSGGVSNSFNNLTHSGAGTLQLLTNALDINGNFTNSAGTFSTNNLNIILSGDWTNNSAFTSGTGTVTFDGNTPSTIRGSTTFHHLSCVTFGKAITFEAGSVQTIEAGATWNFKGNEVGL